MSKSAFLSIDIRSVLPRRTLGGLGLLGALLMAPATYAQQAGSSDRWVSDNLQTYVRSGPSDGYRIVGALKSGQKVQLLQTQGDYSEVRGEGGDRVWILSSDLQSQPGQAERVPALEQQSPSSARSCRPSTTAGRPACRACRKPWTRARR